MTKHTATTNNAQHLYDEIDSILGNLEEYQVRKALAYLQVRYCVLHYCSGPRMPVDLWSSAKLPLEVRRIVRKHRLQIAERMHQGATEVCPNPMLHRMHHKGGVCQACARLETALEQVSSGSVVCSS